MLAAESPVGPTDALATWAVSTPVRFNPAVPTLLTACAIVSVALAVLGILDVISLEWLVGWVCLESLVATMWRRAFHRVVHGIEIPDHALGLLAALLARLESARFASPRLAELHQTLLTDGALPSARIARLRRLVSWSTHAQPAVCAYSVRPASTAAAGNRDRSLARSIRTGGRSLAASRWGIRSAAWLCRPMRSSGRTIVS